MAPKVRISEASRDGATMGEEIWAVLWAMRAMTGEEVEAVLGKYAGTEGNSVTDSSGVCYVGHSPLPFVLCPLSPDKEHSCKWSFGL